MKRWQPRSAPSRDKELCAEYYVGVRFNTHLGPVMAGPRPLVNPGNSPARSGLPSLEDLGELRIAQTGSTDTQLYEMFLSRAFPRRVRTGRRTACRSCLRPVRSESECILRFWITHSALGLIDAASRAALPGRFIRPTRHLSTRCSPATVAVLL